MSRFSNLEFDGHQEGFEENQAVVKDETYYLKEASHAFSKGNFEQALRLFSKVLEYNPNSAEAWTGQVRMLIELGECHEAKVWADKALERLPTAAELLAAKAVALARIGDLKGALAFSDASMEEHGDHPYLWLARGDVMLARKDRIADYCFEKMWMLAKGDWLYAWLAARVYAFHQQFTLALKYAQQAIACSPQHHMAWLHLGQCQLAIGLTGPAHHSFKQALQLEPRFESAQRALIELDHQGPGDGFRNWWRRLFQK